MALFGSSDKKAKPIVKKIRPTVVKTQNVAKELFALAKSYDVKPEILDFNILQVKTFTRVTSDADLSEWSERGLDDLHNLDVENELLNPDFQIKQEYEIEIFAKDKNSPYKDFNIAVGANATKCKVYLSIKQGSKVSYSPGFEQDLRMLVDKAKIRAGILIDVFDEMLDDTLSKISSHVKIEEDVFYEANETYLVAQSYEPTPTKDDALIFHYQKKKEVSENDRVDYSQRGFIQSVVKGELLIEYIKPQEGKPGRNCRGEYMTPKEPDVSNYPDFHVDETITVKESDTNIEYRAAVSGYISVEGNNYSIKSDVDVGEISFKATGSIVTEQEAEVSINVKESDALKDAVGSGIVVDVSEIDIEGNVGSHAKVNAKRATVGGLTHKTAEIRADELSIAVHKGYASGKIVEITRLEHGVVEGDVVKISQAIGGTIKAKELVISLCASHVKAYASKKIEIKKMQGSENAFTIDPLVRVDYDKELEENQEKIKQAEQDIKEIEKEINKYTTLVKNGAKSFQDIKRKLIHYKKNGVKMPEAFVKQYKKYVAMQEHLEKLNGELSIKQDIHKKLVAKKTTFQNDIFKARIINKDKWKGYNEIKFKLIDPPLELKYYPRENSVEHIFGLVENEDGEFEIKPLKEKI